MENKELLLSLCIPTNGISEWVFPVLDSIYKQAKSFDDFEVVVSDNGNNGDFQIGMNEYQKRFPNLHYKKTKALPFLNEIECYKEAKGLFIKFINHRTLLVENGLDYLLDFVRKHKEDKPFVYFTDGKLTRKEQIVVNSFDKFVKELSIYSSWSTGMGFWKEDFEKLDLNLQNFNEMFPHTTILFSQPKKASYILDNTFLLDEIEVDESKKGKYDVYYTFAVEYLGILLDLQRKGLITISTFDSVRKDTLAFLANINYVYHIRKKPSSYILENDKEPFKVFYKENALKKETRKLLRKKALHRLMPFLGK